MKKYYEILRNNKISKNGKFKFIEKAHINHALRMVPGAGLEPARPYERGILNQD